MKERTVKTPLWFFGHIFIGQLLYGIILGVPFGLIISYLNVRYFI